MDRNILIVVLVIFIVISLSSSVCGVEIFDVKYYYVKVYVRDTPPQLVLKYYVPLMPESYPENTTNIHVNTVWVIGSRRFDKYGVTALDVSYNYTESYKYVEPGSYPCWSLNAEVNSSRAVVVSKTYMFDTGEVIRYVKIDAKPDKSIESRLIGEPITYTVNAVFYGSEFEGLTIEDVKNRIGEIIEPELAVAIPYYTAHSEYMGDEEEWFTNRTIKVLDATYSDGKFYVTIRLIDTNMILPVVVYRKVQLNTVCKPTLGAEYVCTYSVEEHTEQLINTIILEEELNKLYNKWREAVSEVRREAVNPEANATKLWEELVVPEEEKLSDYLYILYLQPSIYPQDPFLWLTITDLASSGLGTIVVKSDISLEKIPAIPPPSGKVNIVEWFLEHTERIPVEIDFYLLRRNNYFEVFDSTIYILTAIESGYRINELIEKLGKDIFIGDTLRWYTVVPYNNHLIETDNLYNVTSIVPIWSDFFKDYCVTEEKYIKEVSLQNNTCVVKGTYSDLASFLYEFLHPPTPTATEPIGEQTNNVTITNTSGAIPATLSYSSSQHTTNHGQTTLNDKIIYILFITIVLLGIIAIIIVIKSRNMV